jgi:cytochrome P450
MSDVTELPPNVPIPGAAVGLLFFLGRPHTASRLRARYGPAARVSIPGFGKCVTVGDSALIKQVFTAPADVLHAGETSPLKAILGRNSIFALDEAEHLRERRLMLPPFHGERMGEYERIFEEETISVLADWPLEKEFPTMHSMMTLTLNAIIRAVFGADHEEFEGLRRNLPELVKSGSLMASLPRFQRDYGPRSPWGKFLRLRAEYDALIDTLIAKGRADERLEQRSDVLALLLQARYEDGEEMSNAQISDELLTILAAGHETTAGTLAWAIERLRRHPELLARLTEEASSGGSALREATIWEIQRTRPVIVATSRNVVKPFELGEWTIPPRTNIIVDFLGLHDDPKLFPEPKRFNPDRFLDAPPDTYSWIPFGGGRRRCVGAAFAKLEMDVVLRMLLTRCEFVPTTAPGEKWRFRGVAFVPRKGGRARVRSIDLTPLDAPQSTAGPEAAVPAPA